MKTRIRKSFYLSLLLPIVLFVIFITSVFQKLSNFSSFQNNLLESGLFELQYVKFYALIVVFAELRVCVLIIIKMRYGLIISAFLILIYIFYILVIKNFY